MAKSIVSQCTWVSEQQNSFHPKCRKHTSYPFKTSVHRKLAHELSSAALTKFFYISNVLSSCNTCLCCQIDILPKFWEAVNTTYQTVLCIERLFSLLWVLSLLRTFEFSELLNLLRTSLLQHWALTSHCFCLPRVG